MKNLCWLLCAAVLVLAACGGGNNAKSSNSSGSKSSCGDKCSSSTGDPQTAEECRDRYVAALESLDGEKMKALMSKKDADEAANMEKALKKAKEEIDRFEIEQVDWKQDKEDWVFTYKQTAHMKDGTTDVDPKRTIRIIKEDGTWRFTH